MHLELRRGGREYFYWPFTGLDEATPSVKIGTGDWAALEAAPDYVADPVVAGAAWFRALIAGPDATSNPAGTVLADAGANLVLFRVIGNPEVIIPTNDVWLIVTR